MFTTIVRVLCALVDAAILTAATVALLRWHRRGLERIRTAGRPVVEPRSNVVPLRDGTVVALHELGLEGPV